MNRTLIAVATLLMLTLGATAQNLNVPPGANQPAIVTTYRPSAVVSARLQRQFLDNVRWSAGIPARDQLAAAFAERSPGEIWQELVAADGLKTGDAADALTAYWVLNWITANAAYDTKVDNGPVQAQVRQALANDANFRAMNDRQKQEMTEGYILNFLLEHAALNDAVARKDIEALFKLSSASVARFRQQMGIDLLALAPGPEGLAPKAR